MFERLRRKSTQIVMAKNVVLEKKLQILSDEGGVQGFHRALRLTMLAPRLLGMLPLSGLTCPDSSQLRFRLISPYLPIFIFALFGQLFMITCNLYRMFEIGCSLGTITNCLFYASGCFSTIFMIRIGQRWPDTVQVIEAVERRLPPLPSRVTRQCNGIMIFVLTAALVEHVLCVVYLYKEASACHDGDIWRKYFTDNIPWIYNYIPYSPWKAVVTEMFNIHSTFMWSFNDALVMVCSIYLTHHFLNHNRLLENVMGQETFHLKEFRIQYKNMMNLVNIINKEIGVVIVISFFCNLYWICMQLFNSLNKSDNSDNDFPSVECQQRSIANKSSLEHNMYFAFSFTFLFVKALLVSFLGARIHSNSLVPLSMLFEVSSSNYDIEVQRFIDQVKHSHVAISGLDFFHVTRQMILTLVATIVTYELVLLQLNIDSIITADGNATTTTVKPLSV
ncbi:gustatory receptor for sugar taste 64f [Plutella xylostella]|uniref:gustatory receptor for sugar taste 64f n=1 Tax=Plutella xylostella TaxID=51655 RepID=UPI00203307B1|nr:gustatory receptor for sugar taste 64f [Plutella xylostella]